MGTNFLEGSVAIRQGVMAQSLHSPFRYLCTLIISPLGLLFSRLSSPSSLRLDLPYGRDTPDHHLCGPSPDFLQHLFKFISARFLLQKMAYIWFPNYAWMF